MNFKFEKQAKSATSLGTQSIIKSDKNQISKSPLQVIKIKTENENELLNQK